MGLKKVVIKNKELELIDEIPQYGVNYGKGYIGFCYDKSSFQHNFTFVIICVFKILILLKI